MYGLVVGGLLGMSAVSFAGAYRSWRNWNTSKKRPPRGFMMVVVISQVVIGIVCLFTGALLLAEGPPA